MTTEPWMDHIISEPTVHGRGWEWQKDTGGKYWWCEDNPITKWQRGVGVEKKIHNLRVALLKITCEDVAYHLSKPHILDYGVVVSLCV